MATKEITRVLTPSEWLQAYAVYTLARDKYAESDRFYKELCRMLGVEDGGGISDAIFGGFDTDGRPESFTKALASEGIGKEEAE